MTMALQRYLSFIMIMIYFVACYSTNLQEDPLSSIVVNSPYINDGGIFKDFLMQSTDHVLSLKSKLGDTSPSSMKTFNVDQYGAQGDGKTDDTKAFKKVWQVACSSKGSVVVLAQKNYLVKPITFSGPCKSKSIVVQISGSLVASDNPSDYKQDPTHWLMFDSVQKLSVKGGGTIHGNGNIWWQNSCKTNKKLALTLYKCNNLVVEDLNVKNGQQIHVQFQNSANVRVSGLTVTAPEDSPNTDGIHVTNTQNIQISNSIIGTGDDCISIVNGTKNLKATDITCGPGHGISIGSLGEGGSKEFVSGITVNGAKLSRTTNGVRIKTWQGGSGSASNIKFQNIQMENVTNPIIIDQNYCDQQSPCQKQKSAVQIRNVLYQNIKGTSASDVAMQFNCSQNFPCQGILLQNIGLELEGGGEAKASCNNVKLSYRGNVSPSCNYIEEMHELGGFGKTHSMN
ncbi:putative polygalacturonase [Medicago truncatula]|uniref:endo-polygalacturonase n=1 Tax=Medicago truncatula TaxID=3880 RepID=A0A396JQY0_MEDTR|nr:putative polygalacturonase [Medicago truncatula]